MRVILTANVPKLGQVGDVCNVKPGYGRNYLLPQGFAIVATPGALNSVADLKRTESKRQEKVRGQMSDLAGRIERERLSFTAKVGETGRLYGSITASDIAEQLSGRLGEDVDRRKIILDESIRTLGEHVVPIHLMPGVDAHVTVVVEAEEGGPTIWVEEATAEDEAGLGATAVAFGENGAAGAAAMSQAAGESAEESVEESAEESVEEIAEAADEDPDDLADDYEDFV
jgi:large subunit ribosomal protein L9